MKLHSIATELAESGKRIQVRQRHVPRGADDGERCWWPRVHASAVVDVLHESAACAIEGVQQCVAVTVEVARLGAERASGTA